MKLQEALDKQDEKFRKEAKTALNQVILFLKKNAQAYDEILESNKKQRFKNALNIQGIKLAKKYKNLDIRLWDKTHKLTSSIKGMNVDANISPSNTKRHFTINYPIIDFSNPSVSIETVIKSLKSGMGLFVHEFIHYLDYQRRKEFKGKRNIKFYNDKREKTWAKKGGKITQDEYINSDIEFNAYYQQYITVLDDMFADYAKKNNVTSVLDFKPFLNYIRSVETTKKWEDKLNKKYQRKFLTRLYSYWQGLKRKYG